MIWWAAMLIMIAISMAMSGIMMLLRPKAQKGDVFDSKTYHGDIMENSTDIGTPVNVVLGTHKIAPQILSYFKIAKGDYTTIDALLSGGEGVINGWRDIRLNNQSFFSLFSFKRRENGSLKNGYWLTLGEQTQQVYESCKTLKHGLAYDIAAGFNQTLTIQRSYSADASSSDAKKYQNASSGEPGYLEVWNWKGATEASGQDIDNVEIIQYTGKAQEAGSGYLQFTGCRITKSHLGGYATVRQNYKIKKKDDGTVYKTIPGFSKTVVHHNEVDTLVPKVSPITITTQNKIEAFAVTIGFESGLYKFDAKKGGYQKASVMVGIKWWKDGESWSGSEVAVTKTRMQTTGADGTGDYIRLEQKKNYAWLVDSDGYDIVGTEEELDEKTRWDEILNDDIIKFTLGSKNYECKVVKISKEPVINFFGSEGYETKYRWKLKFEQQEPEKADKYQGPKSAKVAYTITYQETEYSNYFETTIAPDKAKLADYRYTFILPNMEKFDPLDYAKYKIKVEKMDEDMDDDQKGVNKMTLIEIQEITLDKLCYPHEALLALKFNTNEKISGSINNITAIVEGRLLKDVQNPSNPERLSSNFYDMFADSVLNKRYGRGKNINLSASEITDFYSALAAEASFHDQNITENSKTRKRFEVNLNVDFKKPLIDLLQTLAVTVRGGIYWDGIKPLCYTDRSTTPVAMFGAANTIPGTTQGESFDLSDQVNRLYPQFLNKSKNYTQDSISRDFRDENFTYNKVRPKNIQIYGITDRWRASKNASYLLRTAKYLKDGIQFQAGGDAITIDMGKTFYWFIPKKSDSGRILAVGSNTITLDKQITIASGKTYKAILRKSDGAPHAELTVDVGATGLGNKDVIYFTSAISGVTLATCPIYGIGVAGEYYALYRCVKKDSKGNAYEIAGALYDAETFRIYKNDPSSDLSTNDDTTETEETSTTPDNIFMFPPNIISLAARENTTSIGSVDIHITRPMSTIWSRCDIYIAEEDGEIEKFAGTTRGEPLRISNLKLGKEYTIKATSFAANGSPNPTPFETTVTLEGTTPQKAQYLQIVNNRGNETEMFGRDFEVVCGDMTSTLTDDFVKQTNENEGLRYLWEVYYSGIPDTVKLGNIKANGKKAYSEITKLNRFKFTLENNIEATKTLWESYKNVTGSSYNTYYGNPQPQITIKCWLINAWGNMSDAPAEITLTNTEPDMVDANGDTITPTVRKIKSGLRFEWPHPYEASGAPGYDITHFIVKLATDEGFTTGIKRVKVTSLINVDSSVEDISLANYKTEIDGLNPETTYYAQIIPVDAFRKGNPSATVSKKPGLTHDDDAEDKPRPATPNTPVLSLESDVDDDGKTVTNLKSVWTKNSEIDIDGYYLEYRAIKDATATTPPTPTEIDNGETAGGKKCFGSVITAGIDGEAGTGSSESTKVTRRIMSVKNNHTYFLRSKAQNTSGQKSTNWTAWVYIATTKATGGIDNTAPGVPTLAISAKTESIEMTASLATPPADLSGFRFAVKTSAFSGDEETYLFSTIDSSAGKAKVTFYGTPGTTYYIAAQSYDRSKNYSAWSAAQSTTPLSVSVGELSAAYSLWKYEGSVTSSANNKVSWTGGAGNELTKKRNSGTTKAYTVTAATNQTVTGTMYLVVDALNEGASTATFKLVNSTGLAAESDPVVVAKVEQTTASKCNIVRYLDNKEFSVSAYKGGFNRLSALFLDATDASFGELKMQDDSGTSIKMEDSSGNIAIRMQVNNSDDPELVIMRPGEDADNGSDATDPDKVAFSSKLLINATAVRPKIPMVIEEPTPTTLNFAQISSGDGFTARTKTTQYQYMTSVSGTAKRKITADLSTPGGITIPLPYRNVIQQYSDGEVYEEFNIVHNPSDASASNRVYLMRFVCNNSGTAQIIPARNSDKVIWRLEAETFT